MIIFLLIIIAVALVFGGEAAGGLLGLLLVLAFWAAIIGAVGFGLLLAFA